MIRRASVLLCIVQEVVEYLTERVGVKQGQRQIRLDIDFDCHIGILEPVLLLLNTLLDRSAQVPSLWGGDGRCPFESCEIQHIAHDATEAVGLPAHRRRRRRDRCSESPRFSANISACSRRPASGVLSSWAAAAANRARCVARWSIWKRIQTTAAAARKIAAEVRTKALWKRRTSARPRSAAATCEGPRSASRNQPVFRHQRGHYILGRRRSW